MNDKQKKAFEANPIEFANALITENSALTADKNKLETDNANKEVAIKKLQDSNTEKDAEIEHLKSAPCANCSAKELSEPEAVRLPTFTFKKKQYHFAPGTTSLRYKGVVITVDDALKNEEVQAFLVSVGSSIIVES